MKLSEKLKQDHDCGDYGQGLVGYPEQAKALEDEIESLTKANEKLKDMVNMLRNLD